MAMRWILTWKKVEGSDEQKAKARLVVKGFTDPDLTTIRAVSPTLSKVGRNCLLQLAASYKMKLSMGDVKTAFLQGNMGKAKGTSMETYPKMLGSSLEYQETTSSNLRGQFMDSGPPPRPGSARLPQT